MFMNIATTMKNLFGTLMRPPAAVGRAGHSKDHVVGPVSQEAASLAIELGRAPGTADPTMGLGAGPRQALRAYGIKSPLSSYQAARLADIDRTCKGCPNWQKCDGLLERGWDERAMATICPNVAIFRSLAH